MSGLEPPLALLCELTHRCPLRCPYCSNPLDLERRAAELATDDWRRVLDEAAALGVLQVHFSGGEPTLRPDLAGLVAHARDRGLYANLITSGVLLDAALVTGLRDAGLDHVQISIQDAEPGAADRLAGTAGAHARKVKAARLVRAAGLALTVNAVVHRQNLDRLPEMIALAEAMDATRLEVAHVQYHGWALANREALMPRPEQVAAAERAVAAARGRLAIDLVAPDYLGRRPKACLGGWGRRSLNVTPSGKVLPCHAAETIPGMAFETVGERPLAWIWERSPAFARFRGTGWMAEPCRSCPERAVDLGGCRCQALALAGDAAATDPACDRSPRHAAMAALARFAATAGGDGFAYRSGRSSSSRATDAPASASPAAAANMVRKASP